MHRDYCPKAEAQQPAAAVDVLYDMGGAPEAVEQQVEHEKAAAHDYEIDVPMAGGSLEEGAVQQAPPFVLIPGSDAVQQAGCVNAGQLSAAEGRLLSRNNQTVVSFNGVSKAGLGENATYEVSLQIWSAGFDT